MSDISNLITEATHLKRISRTCAKNPVSIEHECRSRVSSILSTSSHTLIEYCARSAFDMRTSLLIRRELCQCSSVLMYNAHTESLDDATDSVPGGAMLSPGNSSAYWSKLASFTLAG